MEEQVTSRLDLASLPQVLQMAERITQVHAAVLLRIGELRPTPPPDILIRMGPLYPPETRHLAKLFQTLFD